MTKMFNTFRTLKFNLFLSFFLIISITVLFSGTYLYRISSTALEKETINHNKQILLSINENLENKIKSLNSIFSLVYSPDIQSRLKKMSEITDRTSWEFINENTQLYRTFYGWMGMVYMNIKVKKFFIINDKGELLLEPFGEIKRNYDFKNMDLYTEALNNNGSPIFALVDNVDFLENPHTSSKLLLVAKGMNDTIVFSNYGVIFILIPWQEFEKDIRNIIDKEKSNYFIIDQDNNIIMTFNETLSTPHSLLKSLQNTNNSDTTEIIIDDNGKYLVSTFTSMFTGWKFVGMASFKDITRNINYIKKIIILLLFLSLVISLCISIIFSRSLLKPFSKLKRLAICIENGNFDHKININSYYEINMLAKAFDNMSQELKSMINRNYVLALSEREAELKALQSQINPHFLFNTLNSISAFAQFKGVDEILEINHALSDILRYSLQDFRTLTTVLEEITHIKNYFIIQNFRYDNSINIIYNIEANVLNCKIVRFILQPLIENALSHGLEKITGYKEIVISANKEENFLVFKVTDNGVGILDNKLEQLLKYIYETDTSFFNQTDKYLSLGLKNVHQRIRLFLGEPYGLKVLSTFGKGTCIEILLPFNSSEI